MSWFTHFFEKILNKTSKKIKSKTPLFFPLPSGKGEDQEGG